MLHVPVPEFASAHFSANDIDIKMFDLRTTMFINHPEMCFIPAISALAMTLTSAPSFTPLVLLLAALLLYSRIIIPRPGKISRGLLLWAFLTLAISLAHLLPSLHALTTPMISLISLVVFSAISSAIALLWIVLDFHVCGRVNKRWIQLIIFPAIWATGWWVVARFNPFGHLLTWSPVLGLDWYTWLSPIFGPIVLNWIVAAWAVVCSQAVGDWFHRPTHLTPDDPPHDATVHSTSQGVSLAIILILLAIPSFIITDLPNPPFSDRTTPLTVGCVLPLTRMENPTPTLDDFIFESKKLTNAKILLWPEGAVRFDSDAEKQDALDRVRREVRGRSSTVRQERWCGDRVTTPRSIHWSRL
jgi:hypothetical protein